MKLNKFHWLSAVFFFALLCGVVGYLIFSSDSIPEKPLVEFQGVNPSLSSNTEQQRITVLTLKLAELQSQVLRLNALGDRLADDANIPKEEFNFVQMPPSGGPADYTDVLEALSVDKLFTQLSLLEESILYEERQLNTLESIALGHYIENAGYLSGRPVNTGWLSSYYGMRKDPFSGQPAMHKGLDFAGQENADIVATASGIVSWASERYGYGQLVEINHGDGFKTRYGHNKTILVNVGDVVTKGQVIAKMGSTGRSTGPHVHYEILHKNKHINPIKYVYRKAKK